MIGGSLGGSGPGSGSGGTGSSSIFWATVTPTTRPLMLIFRSRVLNTSRLSNVNLRDISCSSLGRDNEYHTGQNSIDSLGNEGLVSTPLSLLSIPVNCALY